MKTPFHLLTEYQQVKETLESVRFEDLKNLSLQDFDEFSYYCAQAWTVMEESNSCIEGDKIFLKQFAQNMAKEIDRRLKMGEVSIFAEINET